MDLVNDKGGKKGSDDVANVAKSDGLVALRHLHPTSAFTALPPGGSKIVFGPKGSDEAVQRISPKLAEKFIGYDMTLLDPGNGNKTTMKRFERV